MKTKIFPPPSIAVHNVLVGPQDSLKVLSSAVVAVVHRREDQREEDHHLGECNDLHVRKQGKLKI